MDLSFIDQLVAAANIEKNCQNIKIKFPGSDDQARKDLIHDFFQEVFRQKIKVKIFSFRLKTKAGELFDFILKNSDTSLACIAKNGTLSLYLSREEVAELQALSGQSDNHSYKVAIYAFDPKNLQNLNYTIFRSENLTECVIENS
jgi:hypothetical protein